MTAVLTRHARERVIEFGLGLDIVTDIATRPDVAHTNQRGESVRWSDRFPDWTVVVGDDGVVITVLRRTRERWEHAAAPAPRRTPPTPSATLPPPPAGRAAEGDRQAERPSVTRRPAPRLVRGGVVSRVVDPDALRVARVLADDDPRRLVLNPDGSVTVLNQPRKGPRP